MAKKITKTKAAIPKWKKKKWFEIVAPMIYSEKIIGETTASDPDTIIGRTVDANLMNLIGNARKQNFSVKLRVEKVQGNKCITKPIKLTMLPASVRRLIRARRDRVDLSFVAITKDGVNLRFKPLILTRNLAPNSTLTDIRAKAKEFISEFATQNNYEAIFDSVTRANLQKELKNALDKVYPIKTIEMRTLEVEIKKGIRKLPEITLQAENTNLDNNTKEEKKEEKSE